MQIAMYWHPQRISMAVSFERGAGNRMRLFWCGLAHGNLQLTEPRPGGLAIATLQERHKKTVRCKIKRSPLGGILIWGFWLTNYQNK